MDLKEKFSLSGTIVRLYSLLALAEKNNDHDRLVELYPLLDTAVKLENDAYKNTNYQYKKIEEISSDFVDFEKSKDIIIAMRILNKTAKDRIYSLDGDYCECNLFKNYYELLNKADEYVEEYDEDIDEYDEDIDEYDEEYEDENTYIEELDVSEYNNLKTEDIDEIENETIIDVLTDAIYTMMASQNNKYTKEAEKIIQKRFYDSINVALKYGDLTKRERSLLIDTKYALIATNDNLEDLYLNSKLVTIKEEINMEVDYKFFNHILSKLAMNIGEIFYIDNKRYYKTNAISKIIYFNSVLSLLPKVEKNSVINDLLDNLKLIEEEQEKSNYYITKIIKLFEDILSNNKLRKREVEKIKK